MLQVGDRVYHKITQRYGNIIKRNDVSNRNGIIEAYDVKWDSGYYCDGYNNNILNAFAKNLVKITYEDR